MTIGERIFGPHLGRRMRVGPDGELIASDAVSISSVAGVLFVSAGILGILSPVVTAFGADSVEGFRPGHVAAVASVAFLSGLVTFRIGDSLPWGWVIAVLFGAVVLVGFASYFSGPVFGPFGSSLFVWPCLAAALFGHRRLAIVFVSAIAICQAIVVAIQPATPSPVSRWLLVVGTCAATVFVVDTAMSLLMKSLDAEDRANRELALASQHKSDFLASMSHELRTPLNAIIGFSDVLAAQHFGELNERQLDYVGDVQEAGRHLLSLINDILDLSKIESGAMELDFRTFSLADTIESALNLIRTRAAENGVRLDTEISVAASEAYGDERRVKQVVANLLSNAVKFTPAGGSIAVRADVVDGVTRVAVSDTGIGISAEDAARIFEDFQQAGDASTAAEGTGLGLALCRRLVELHGGEISVSSAPQEGSVFTFTLPLAVGARA